MKIILETDRLLLREFLLEDAPNILDLNSDPEVTKYTGDPPFKNIEETREFLKTYDDYKNNGIGRWAVIDKASDKFIGWCGLKLNEEKLIDLGFRFFKSEWNKGYATEAAKACLAYGFNTLNYDQIIGRAAQENIASIKVLNKIGMQYYKVDECHGILDAHYYVLNREDYKLLRTKL